MSEHDCGGCGGTQGREPSSASRGPHGWTRRLVLRVVPVLPAALALLARRYAWARSIDVPAAQLQAIRQVGGSTIVKSEGLSVLVVRDGPKSVRAVNAKCTHKGCTVGYDAAKQVIACKCHKSVYELATGKNVSGPSRRPLEVIQVTEDDAGIHLQLPEPTPTTGEAK